MLNLTKVQTRPIHHKPPTKSQHKKAAKYLSGSEELVFVSSIGMRYFWFNLIFFLVIPLGLFYLSIFMFSEIVSLPSSLDWLKYVGIVAVVVLLINLKKTSNILRKRQSYTYILTNKRCLIVSGIFTRKIITAPLDRITHITVEQSFAQRFLYNTGHLLIITAGFDQREIVIEHIANPVKFKIFIEELSSRVEKKPQSEENSEPQLRALTLG